jgi:hypothetical protein
VYFPDAYKSLAGQWPEEERERGVMRGLLIEAQTGEPAPRQVHAQLLHQLPLTGDAVQVADQQDAQQ